VPRRAYGFEFFDDDLDSFRAAGPPLDVCFALGTVLGLPLGSVARNTDVEWNWRACFVVDLWLPGPQCDKPACGLLVWDFRWMLGSFGLFDGPRFTVLPDRRCEVAFDCCRRRGGDEACSSWYSDVKCVSSGSSDKVDGDAGGRTFI